LALSSYATLGKKKKKKLVVEPGSVLPRQALYHTTLPILFLWLFFEIEPHFIPKPAWTAILIFMHPSLQ
jgi:hypothetical protein